VPFFLPILEGRYIENIAGYELENDCSFRLICKLAHVIYEAVQMQPSDTFPISVLKLEILDRVVEVQEVSDNSS
jgi:hypothetical protein